MDYRNIITFDKDRRNGQPCIRGTRIAVSDILEYLGSGMSNAEILNDFPALTEEDIRASLLFAAELVHSSSRLLSVERIPAGDLDETQLYLKDILDCLKKIANSRQPSPQVAEKRIVRR
jgi:uncharacterized protein (DUF433 family)